VLVVLGRGAARAETARFAVSKRMAKSCITVYFFSAMQVERKVLLNGVSERRKSVDKKIGGERTNAVYHE